MANLEESLQGLTALMNEFFAPQTGNERKREIETTLNEFTQMSNAWEMCLFFMANTQNEYVQMFCLNVIESVISRKWMNLSPNEKLEIRSRIYDSLLQHHSTLPSYIRNKLAKLLVSIGRNDWPHFYPDFFSNILQLAQQSETALLGVVLLQTVSEELAAPRDDLSMSRKEELLRLLQHQVPNVLNILNNILEAMLEKHRHLVVATPPPSPTSGDGSSRSSRQTTNQLISSSPIANANFVSLLLGSPNRGPQMEALPPLDEASHQLCWTGLTCLSHFLSWIPLSTVVRPQLLSTIFHFAAFGCQPSVESNSAGSSRSGAFSSSTHKLGILAMNCINEILGKNCVPQEFEDFLLQMFQQTFSLLQKITKSSNTSSTGNRLEELDEVYVEKFTDFLRLFVSVHLRRFESNPQFPVLEFLSLLFKYTFKQPSIDGYYRCLDIWTTFLDFLISKLDSRLISLDDISARYKEALTSLLASILQKLQFRYNQSELEELDDDVLDDDDETEWQHFLRQNLELVAKVAELFTADVFQILWEPFQEYVETFFGMEKYVDSSGSERKLLVSAENDCRRLHCALRDLSSLLQALGRLATHFIGEHFSACFSNGAQIVTRLVEVMSYGSRVKLFEVTTSAGVLQQDFIELHAQSLAAVKAYTHWMSQFYSESLRTNQHQDQFRSMVMTVTEALAPLINKQTPEKIVHSSAHLLLSISTTVRPAFLLESPAVLSLYDNAIQGLYQALSVQVQLLVYRSLSHYLVLPWPLPVSGNQDWDKRAEHHKLLVSRLTAKFTAMAATPEFAASPAAQEQAKPVVKWTMQVCQDWVESLAGEVVKSKQMCCLSLQEVTQTALAIFPVYVKDAEVIGHVVAFFLAVFKGLRVQMGMASLEKIVHTFMNVFSSDMLAQIINQETSGAFRVIENFLILLELIVQEPGSQFKAFLPRVVSISLGQIHPIVAPRQSPDLKCTSYHLMHEILMNNWRYFFRGSVLDSMKEGVEDLENSEQFVAILQAYGQSFLQSDISIFRQNLDSLESLHFKWKLYNKKIFKKVMCPQFLTVLLQVLVQKSHDLLQEEIVISVYNMAAADFEAFFSQFLPQFLHSLPGIDDNQKSVLANNFKTEQDLPSFTQTVQRFVNDIRYYSLINSSLPAGSISFT
ncbi:exportin-6 [Aplysia californica]|uniref:Exportin-6 n=1 Tax=Aplysia californica TaxID=6500 RepID=A0ABM0JLH8_APLCA|nr:exportin-6 [Aplysia californica]